MKTMRKYLCLVLVLCFSSAALAGGGDFWGYTSDWWDGNNWGNGAPPLAGDTAWMDADAVIGSGAGVANWLYAGWWNPGSVTINPGASLTVYTSQLGCNNGSVSNDGYISVEGLYSAWGDTVIGVNGGVTGSIFINGDGVVDNSAVTTYIGHDDLSNGYLELNDNAYMVTNTLDMQAYWWDGQPTSSRVQLNGGTLEVLGGGLWMTHNTVAVIDFDGGCLKWLGDNVGSAGWMEDNGFFTSTDGLDITFDGTYTNVCEIPEPATLAILSLGGMLLFRRKRA